MKNIIYYQKDKKEVNKTVTAETKIVSKLHELEKIYNVKILWAVESGSRVWGFNNPDSDYDIRFIYKFNDLHDYVCLNPRDDVIRCFKHDFGDFDFEGWDIRKMLNLHYKNNPSLFEWQKSPTRYIGGADTYEKLFYDLPYFDESGLMHHYKSMAIRTFDKYVASQPLNDLKVLKKVLQVIRCILCFEVLFKFDVYPELNFNDLIKQAEIDDEFTYIFNEIQNHYVNKTDLSKILDTRVFQCANYWIIDKLEGMRNRTIPQQRHYKDFNVYNEKFYDIVMGGLLD